MEFEGLPQAYVTAIRALTARDGRAVRAGAMTLLHTGGTTSLVHDWVMSAGLGGGHSNVIPF